MVADRISELHEQTKQLRARRAELAAARDERPTAPRHDQPGTNNQRKALVEALVPET